MREKTGETAENKVKEYNDHLKETYGFSHDVPIAFVDNYPSKDAEEQKHFAEAITQIRQFVEAVKRPFDVQRVKRDALSVLQPSEEEKEK